MSALRLRLLLSSSTTPLRTPPLLLHKPPTFSHTPSLLSPSADLLLLLLPQSSRLTSFSCKFSRDIVPVSLEQFVSERLLTQLPRVYAAIAIALNAVICSAKGNAAVGVLIAIFFLEAPMYPTLFTLGTANL